MIAVFDTNIVIDAVAVAAEAITLDRILYRIFGLSDEEIHSVEGKR